MGASNGFFEPSTTFVVDIPPGEYDVRLTLAEVTGADGDPFDAVAYASVIISEESAATVEEVIPAGASAPAGDEFYGIAVDGGLAAFGDADAGADAWESEAIFAANDAWFDQMYDGTDYALWHLSDFTGSPDGQAVLLCQSGWGDGSFPVMVTRDNGGEIVGVHLDFLVAFEDGG